MRKKIYSYHSRLKIQTLRAAASSTYTRVLRIINFRFSFDQREFVQMQFAETMFDHLDIESKIIIAESDEGRRQVAKYGVAPPIGILKLY